MQNLNLYTYNNQSLADIHREYLKSKEVKNEVVTEPFFTIKKIVILAIVLLVVITSSIIISYILLREPPAVVSITPVGPDLRTSEEKLGYVSVQIFEFSDEEAIEPQKYVEKIKEKPTLEQVVQPLRTDIYSETKKAIEAIPAPVIKASNDVKENKLIEKSSEKKEDIKEVAKVTPNEPKKYYVLFENINQKQYNDISNSSKQFGFVPQVMDSSSNNKIVWQVYRIDPKGKIKIGENNVELVKSFATKEDAVDFAKNNNIESVIRLEELVEKNYTLKLCCSDLEKSKKVAEASNITDIVIKIVREK